MEHMKFFHGAKRTGPYFEGWYLKQWSPSGATIRQGKHRLKVELLETRAQPLRAPAEGRMERTVHESLCAPTRYSLWHGETLLFRHTDPSASFEYSGSAR